MVPAQIWNFARTSGQLYFLFCSLGIMGAHVIKYGGHSQVILLISGLFEEEHGNYDLKL